jgi:hypothetical protein
MVADSNGVDEIDAVDDEDDEDDVDGEGAAAGVDA